MEKQDEMTELTAYEKLYNKVMHNNKEKSKETLSAGEVSKKQRNYVQSNLSETEEVGNSLENIS